MFSLIKGTLSWCFAKKVVRVLLLGLDNSGKTVIFTQTFLEQIKKLFGQRSMPIHKIPPTVGLNSKIYIVAKLTHNNIQVLIWDLGGKEGIRQIWNHYYSEAQALIFMIDGCDRNRFQELHDVLKQTLAENQLKGVPLAIVINKHDQDSCASVGFIREMFETDTIEGRSVEIMYGSSYTQEGIEKVINWILSVA